jgi:hypothetical protein
MRILEFDGVDFGRRLALNFGDFWLAASLVFCRKWLLSLILRNCINIMSGLMV